MVSIFVSSIVVFTLVILFLIFSILTAKQKLIPQTDISIIINDNTASPLIVKPGNTLLSVLASNDIYLASACGGKGTCAMCECQILSGGGEVLVTETNHLSRREVAEHKRLACQVKVKENLVIKIPEAVFGVKKWECTVASNDNVSTYIKELVVHLPQDETLTFRSGDYIQVDVPETTINFATDLYNIPERFKDDYDKYDIWSLKTVVDETLFRAYSMANHPAEGQKIMLNIRLATPPWNRQKNTWLDVPPGFCSSYVFALKPGDKVSISGPYGEFHVKDTKKEMVYIGGGAGMAPLRSHIFHLFHTLKTNRQVSYWYGARSKREIFYEEDFRAIEREFPNFKFVIALSEPLPEDNWTGETGFIHNVVLKNYLDKHPDPDEVEYYLCGPPMMNTAVQNMLEDLGVASENVAFDDFGG